MEQKGLISVSTNSVTKELELSRIDDDLILFDDFANLPVPYEPRRNALLLACVFRETFIIQPIRWSTTCVQVKH